MEFEAIPGEMNNDFSDNKIIRDIKEEEGEDHHPSFQNKWHGVYNFPRQGMKMTSDQSFVEFIVDQMEDAGVISFRKMFGEYAIYCNGKVVALVCNNQLFVKPTASGRSYIGAVSEAAPYPGAKLYLLIEDAFEDREWISGLIKTTANELPISKQRVSKNDRKK